MDNKRFRLGNDGLQVVLYKQLVVFLFSLVNLEQLVKMDEWRLLHPLNQVASYLFACMDKAPISVATKT